MYDIYIWYLGDESVLKDVTERVQRACPDVELAYDNASRTVRLTHAGDLIPGLAVSQYPGQCAVLIAHHLYDSSAGLVAATLELARVMHYNMVLVSHKANHRKLQAWKDAGFKLVDGCYNDHSGNNIEIYSYRLDKDKR